MTAITRSAIGAISFRSASIALSKSYWIAEPPPTRTVTPSNRLDAASRMSGTTLKAAFVNGSSSRITSTVVMSPSVGDLAGRRVAEHAIDFLNRGAHGCDVLLAHRPSSLWIRSVVG